MKLFRWLGQNPPIGVPVMLAGVLFGVATMLFCMGSWIAANPPRWWLDKHSASRQIKAQTEPTAQIVTTADRLSYLYIPTDIEVEPGGDGIVLRGPRDSIYRFHRQLHRLDENKHGPFNFEWRTE